METSKKTSAENIEVRCLFSYLHVEQRDGESDSRMIVGYGATFETWSEPICGWFREKIARDAFADCDMSDVIACFNHNPDNLLARTSSGTLTLNVDERGLRFSFEAPRTTLGNDILEQVRRGDISKCSFRFVVGEDSWVYADEGNGLEYDERTLLKIRKLFDVAPVVYPAYKDTEVSVRHLEDRKAEHLLRAECPIAASSSCRQREVEFYQLKNNSHE